MLAAHAPNDGHRVVADWQRRGLVGTVVTQNVDGFHTRAGAGGVLELHGTLANVRCDRCGERAPRRASSWRRRASPAHAAASAARASCCSARRCPTATLRAAWTGVRARAAVPRARLVAGGLAREPAARGGGRGGRAARDHQPRSDAARSHGDAGDQRVDRGDAAGGGRAAGEPSRRPRGRPPRARSAADAGGGERGPPRRRCGRGRAERPRWSPPTRWRSSVARVRGPLPTGLDARRRRAGGCATE